MNRSIRRISYIRCSTNAEAGITKPPAGSVSNGGTYGTVSVTCICTPFRPKLTGDQEDSQAHVGGSLARVARTCSTCRSIDSQHRHIEHLNFKRPTALSQRAESTVVQASLPTTFLHKTRISAETTQALSLLPNRYPTSLAAHHQRPHTPRPHPATTPRDENEAKAQLDPITLLHSLRTKASTEPRARHVRQIPALPRRRLRQSQPPGR